MTTYIEHLETEFAKTIDPATIIRNFLKFTPTPIVMIDSLDKIILWTYSFNVLFQLEGKDLSGISIHTINGFNNILPQISAIDTKLIDIDNKPYELSVDKWENGYILSFKDVTLYKNVVNIVQSAHREHECIHNPKCVLKDVVQKLKK